MKERKASDDNANPPEDSEPIHSDMLFFAVELGFSQGTIDLLIDARLVVVSALDGSSETVSTHGPIHIPLTYFHSPSHRDHFIQAFKNRFADAVPHVFAHTIAEELKAAINKAGVDAGVSNRDKVQAIGLKERIKSEEKFHKKRAGVRVGAPLKRSPAALRREVKNAARHILRHGEDLKLSGVAAKLGRSEAALSRELARKGISWRAIKAEVQITT